jgi:hypothetical protein
MVLAIEYHRPAVAAARGEITDSVSSMENLGLRLNENRRSWTSARPRPLYQLLSASGSWRATKPVDKVYGLLGMSRKVRLPILSPDYF